MMSSKSNILEQEVINFFLPQSYTCQSAGQLWMRVIIWYGIIFLFSSIPNYSGRELNFETVQGIMHFASKKLAHLTEYGFLMIYLFRATEINWGKSCRRPFLISFIFSILFAVLDEWHQTFVYGRAGTVADVFVDSVGALFGYIYYVRTL